MLRNAVHEASTANSCAFLNTKDGNAVPVDSGNFLTMGTSFPREMTTDAEDGHVTLCHLNAFPMFPKKQTTTGEAPAAAECTCPHAVV